MGLCCSKEKIPPVSHDDPTVSNVVAPRPAGSRAGSQTQHPVRSRVSLPDTVAPRGLVVPRIEVSQDGEVVASWSQGEAILVTRPAREDGYPDPDAGHELATLNP